MGMSNYHIHNLHPFNLLVFLMQSTHWLSYKDSPRAQIFRRDHRNVNSVLSMAKIMRSNDWRNDPVSQRLLGLRTARSIITLVALNTNTVFYDVFDFYFYNSLASRLCFNFKFIFMKSKLVLGFD